MENKMNRKLLAEFKYDLAPVVRGYNRRTLYVNVGTKEIVSKPVSDMMIDKFVGGKGFDLYLMWQGVKDDTKWNSPENEICISFGPLCGNTSYPGSGKSIVTTISPLTGIPVDCNVGGHFGPYAKFSGWDAIELQGKSEEDVIVYIDGDTGMVQIFTAPDTEINSHIFAEELIKEFADSPDKHQFVSVVSTGTAADHVNITCLNFSFWDKRRKVARLKQAGRGGTGTVFRDKGIKAMVVKYSGLKVPHARSRHRSPDGDNERLRPASHPQLQIWSDAGGYRLALQRVYRPLYPGYGRWLLVWLLTFLLQSCGQL
jgi:aldehyde:ferredoxin oxidoreductase